MNNFSETAENPLDFGGFFVVWLRYWERIGMIKGFCLDEGCPMGR
ncbi:hypothetical protein [Jeotgalicoccus coquinae]|uniref:Uncharacterized protein n=1 Tax=Jeotgalicoccus coquinae TaxID=709509 RepID=A0ABR6QMU0_9STAP|nr:hypothetical protein [Jeotgalicoccus coquinae]MBB6422913.1 hypothetical protein [Jeotgalicoccus coquinae]